MAKKLSPADVERMTGGRLSATEAQSREDAAKTRPQQTGNFDVGPRERLDAAPKGQAGEHTKNFNMNAKAIGDAAANIIPDMMDRLDRGGTPDSDSNRRMNAQIERAETASIGPQPMKI